MRVVCGQESLIARRMPLPFQLRSCIKRCHGVSEMASRRYGWARLLSPIIASLLILSAVGAELPELLSLVDNTTNDFVIQKTGPGSGTSRLAVTLPAILPPDTKCLGAPAFNCDAATVFRTAIISSELFLLHSVLRI